MTNGEVVQTLVHRLDNAEQNLLAVKKTHSTGSAESVRIRGKIEGVRLARSYAEESLRCLS